jgi:hypothetical protein
MSRSHLVGHIIAVFALASIAVNAKAQDAPPSLTIYNQNFAVVREGVRLNLKPGDNRVTYTDTTAHVEPDSVVLRDPTGKRTLRILEQNYEADPISQDLLLSKFEGQMIDFVISREPSGKEVIVPGKIIRSGYVPHPNAYNRYGNQYAGAQYAMAYGASGQAIIEMEGKLRFGLPGTPIFPSLGDDTILKPTLSWVLDTDKPGEVAAELSYVTGGMTWEADYNIVAPETSDKLELTGMVTMDNQSGKTFENARVKLMAGDVSKIQQNPYGYGVGGAFAMDASRNEAQRPAVTERSFDEYHLYTLERPTTLKDRETKQVEFVRAAGIASQRVYIYDGVKIDYNQYRGWSDETIRNQREYGTVSNPKIWVMREFKNTKENGLGIPLPKGRVRFYRRDDRGGALEFTGENLIDHTPQGETVRVYTGDAFDIVGERRQVNYVTNYDKHVVDESFEITLRNRKTEPVTVRVVEHLYRGVNWEITEKSYPYEKKDSRTIEYSVALGPNEEKKINYTAHYTW